MERKPKLTQKSKGRRRRREIPLCASRPAPRSEPGRKASACSVRNDSGRRRKQKSETRSTLVRGRRDFFDVNGFLRRIEMAGQQHMRGREVSNGFWIFDNPDCLIIVCHKDGSLGFPFRVPD